MKTVIITSVLFVVSFCSFGQHKNPCDKSYSIVGSMSMGGSTHGTTMNLEIGLWGRKNGIGISSGVMFYNGKGITNPKSGFTNYPLITEYYLRPTIKLDHKSQYEGFHHALTAFAGSKGNGGASYRAYYQWGPNLMFGLEPYISVKNGKGLNLITTFAF